MKGRRASFWLAVAGVSVLAPFALQLVAEKVPQIGLDRFIAFTYRSGGS